MGKWDGKIPFDVLGNQMHYGYKAWDPRTKGYVEPDWHDNSIIEGTLEVTGCEKGIRSGIWFKGTLVPKQNPFQSIGVTIFLKDFMSMLPRLEKGKLTSSFTWCKKGANFGLREGWS